MSAPKQQSVEVTLLPEPKVLGKATSETDCKSALLSGPYGARNASHSNRISLGIIGTYSLIDQTKEWLRSVNDSIDSTSDRDESDAPAQRRHKLLFPDFPGCPAAFDKSMVLEPQFEQKVTLDELSGLDKRNKVAYIEGLLQLIEDKIQRIMKRQNANQTSLSFP